MKLGWPNLTDRRQLGLAWVSTLALLLVGLLLGARSEADYRQQASREAAVQADILAASVSAALAFDDRPTMREYVNALSANPRVAAAGVYDAAGRPVVVYARRGSPPPPALAQAVGRGRQGGAVVVTAPVAERGARLGTVYLATRPEPLPQLLARHSGLALLTVMALILLSVVLRAAHQLRARTEEVEDINRMLLFEMTERMKAEEALRQSQKMEALGQLTGGIAHDFNNLLQVIHGAFELIRRKPDAHDRVTGWAENGLQAAERGASLTRQLLAFSRAQKLELRPFVVADLIGDMRELLARTLGPDIALEFHLEEAGKPVLSDRTQLELAVLNLAINARDAMPDGGTLTISTRTRTVDASHPVLDPDDYVELTVADTGAGMSPEVAARAFDPFFTTKGVGKGTGLGLSQVYGVARQAGGVASIESLPGVGTTVRLLLRCSTEAAPGPAAEASQEPVTARPGGATLLVVDDDPGVRQLVCDTLEMLGYRVLSAVDGPSALAVLHRTRPDLMLIDFAMPGMNGAEVAGLARQTWAELPIVFASGYADTGAVEAALGGQAVILAKPFDMDLLARTIAAELPAA